jgi:hypothetical protein
MSGDVAVRLLELIGHGATVPGALLAEDVPAALARLQAAIEKQKQLPEAQTQEAENDEPAVSLPHRAADRIAQGCGQGRLQRDVGQRQLSPH